MSAVDLFDAEAGDLVPDDPAGLRPDQVIDVIAQPFLVNFNCLCRVDLEDNRSVDEDDLPIGRSRFYGIVA